MRKLEELFNTMIAGVETFKTRTTEDLTERGKRYEALKAECERYNETVKEKELSKGTAEIDKATKEKLETERENLKKVIEPVHTELKQVLHDRLASIPNEVFLSILTCYATYEIKPSRSEIEMLTEVCAGSLLGLKCLNRVLNKTGSEYRVTIPDIEAFETDLKALESLLNDSIMWSDSSTRNAFVPLYKGERRGDSFYKWDGISLDVASRSFEVKTKGFSEMLERWSNNITPTIEEYKGEKKPEEALQADADRVTRKDIETVPQERKVTERVNPVEILDNYK